ncbi:MAG: hypothetical protein HZA59_04690 [Hydrogenophilales bacterium]|nr:hypothetical protein [Hydrogenophilales bacterium]
MRRYLIFLLCWAPFSFAADTRITREGLDLYLSARTPEQTSAFYSARGLPPIAVQEIAKSCFLTVGLHNRGKETVWLNLATWRFADASGREIARISLPEWRARWQALHLPLAAQATFGWTQLPETRDMQPDENVGGNVPVVPPPGEFTLTARFPTGAAGTGKPIEISVPGLSCPRDGAVK